jgi:glutamate-1-semialdehyde 2,1-aminomutase
MNRQRSLVLFQKALELLPGGVNSPVRAFRAVGAEPLFFSRGAGAYLYDVDGNAFLDYIGSWGPLILGHAHPEVVAALEKALRSGTSFGACTPGEVELAEEIRRAFPAVEKVRLTNSGTEATMSAIRVARAFTRRDTIIKFEGCYHGHADYLLVKAGSGVATLGLPDSPGVPAEFARFTLALPFNDLSAVERALETRKGEIAAVIVEPVVGNMGCVPPEKGFLGGLRELTRKYGALLIMDEVMTGFRVAYGGAQERFGVQGDLTTLGKIIGGGLPVGAYGGRKDIMSLVAPEGPVYQAGTLSGNPLAVTAGLATLRLLRQPGSYSELERRGTRLAEGFRCATQKAAVAATVNQVGSMFTLFFTPQPVTNWETAKAADTAQFGRFFGAMLERGVYLPPSQFEAAFVSLAHTDEDIERTIAAAQASLTQLEEKVEKRR